MTRSKKVISIRLPVELDHLLKEKAVEESTTVTEIITRYIKKGLSSQEKILDQKFRELENQLKEVKKDLGQCIKEARDEVKRDLRKVEGKAELAAQLIAGREN